MPTILGDKYDLNYTGKPPMMSKEDLVIWVRYMDKIGGNYEAIYFNVHVGDGRDPGAEGSEKFKRFWQQKTQLRIDVLVVYPKHIAIVELRDSAGPDAVGRVLAYRDLLESDNPFNRQISLEIITNFYNEVTHKLCNKFNIAYAVV